MSTLSEYRAVVARLAEAAAELSVAAAPLDVPPLEQQEWHRTLTGKLVPQLGAGTTLIVAVVGGTNIGKSVVFNHVCGSKVSSSAPTAAGTKHPTVAVPPSSADPEVLARAFPGFEITQWSSEDDPLRADERDLLFWKTSPSVPENLIVLDTPDVDSTARVNWQRADKVRRSADLLLAVITQQKYNDAAVRQFFRKAADEGQVVAVVLNQILLPEDEAYWTEWVGTFCSETGIEPELVYLAPQDRAAAERLELPFLRRHWPPDPDADDDAPRDLLAEISDLHFGTVKVRALRGALQQVSDEVPGWLTLLSRKAGDLSRSEQRTSSAAPEAEWPPLPKAVVTEEVSQWWSAQRTGLAAGVDAVYGTLGEGLSQAWGGLRSFAGSPPQDAWETYRRREWEHGIWPAVERSVATIERLADEGTAGVRHRARAKLASTDRASLRSQLRTAHESRNLKQLLDSVTAEQLSTFKEDAPEEYARLRKVRNAVVLARPALTVGGLAIGAGPALDFGAPFLIDMAAGGALGGAAGGAASKAVSGGLNLYDESLRAIPVEFARRRVEWLRGWLREHFTGDLPDVLRAAASIDEHAAFAAVHEAADDLRGRLAADGLQDADDADTAA